MQAGGRRFDPGWLHFKNPCYEAYSLRPLLGSQAEGTSRVQAGIPVNFVDLGPPAREQPLRDRLTAVSAASELLPALVFADSRRAFGIPGGSRCHARLDGDAARPLQHSYDPG